MLAGYRVLFSQSAAEVRPAHLYAAAREAGLRVHTGPQGASVAACEMIVIKPRFRRSRTEPLRNNDTGRPTACCPTTLLSARFESAGSTAEVQQATFSRWASGIAVLLFLPLLVVGLSTTAPEARFSPASLFAFAAVSPFFLLGVFMMYVFLRGRREDPEILIGAWRRALELAGAIDASRMPAPEIQPIPKPWIGLWPEKRPRRGLRLMTANSERLSRNTVEAVFEQGRRSGFWIDRTDSLACDELVVTVHPSALTYRHDRHWGRESYDLPHVRMLIRFAAPGAAMEIRAVRLLRWPLGVFFVTGFCALIVFKVFVEPAHLPFGVMGVVLGGGLLAAAVLGWLWRTMAREARKLRAAWEEACAVEAVTSAAPAETVP